MNTPTCAQRLTDWLIERAVRAAPPPLRERLAEEWRADLAARRSALSRLQFALGCCWATRVIAQDRVTVALPAGAAGVGVKLAFADWGRGARWFSRRSLTWLIIVAGLHAVLVFALMHGLVAKVERHLPAPLQTVVVPPPDRPDLPTMPKPKPVLDGGRWKWPPLDPPNVPPADDGAADAPPVPGDPGPQPPAGGADPALPPRAPVRVAGGPGSGFPDADDYYPSLSKTLNEQGIATVNVCVDGHGRLTAEPAIVAGTHSKRLDAGALELARAGSGHYRPTLEDGLPVAACYSFRVRFQLRN